LQHSDVHCACQRLQLISCPTRRSSDLTRTGDATLISIPRNLQHVPFPKSNPLHKIYPKGFYCPQRGVGNECLMDAVWTEAGTNQDRKSTRLNSSHVSISYAVYCW